VDWRLAGGAEMVTFGLFSLFFSIEPTNERESTFSLDTFGDKTFAITTAVSLVLLVLSTSCAYSTP
jgi:P-type Ca2+ transporter type 2C